MKVALCFCVKHLSIFKKKKITGTKYKKLKTHPIITGAEDEVEDSYMVLSLSSAKELYFL